MKLILFCQRRPLLEEKMKIYFVSISEWNNFYHLSNGLYCVVRFNQLEEEIQF